MKRIESRIIALRSTKRVPTRKLTAALLVAGIILSGVGSIGVVVHTRAANSTPRQNVWMFYMCGDNEFSPGITQALERMHKAGGSSDQVTIIAMCDYNDTARDGIYYITGSAATDIKLWTPPSELNTGDPATLAFFINYTHTNYPANRYEMTIWDHGAGMLSVILDQHPVLSSIKIKALGTTLAASGVHFDLLQFEACVMDMAEVGYELRSSVNVMVASEEVSYMSTPYTQILQWFNANPEASAPDLGKHIVDGYFDIAQPYRGTLAVIDLTQMSAVASALDDLGDRLVANMPEWHGAILIAANQTQRYTLATGYPDHTDYADIIDFTKKLDAQISEAQFQRTTAAVRTAVNQAVLYQEWKGTDLQNSTGLSTWIFGGSALSAVNTSIFGQNFVWFNTLQFAANTSWGKFNTELMKTPTTLGSLTVDPESPYSGSAFLVLGTIGATSPVPNGDLVYLQRWNGSSFVNVKSTGVQDKYGNFKFNYSEKTPGTYSYRVHYPGSSHYQTDPAKDFLGSYSPSVDVTVQQGEKYATYLYNPFAEPWHPRVGTTAFINGTLVGAGGAAWHVVPNALIYLQTNVSGTWKNLGSPRSTIGNGSYSFPVSESVPGGHYYRAVYLGNDTYVGNTSASAYLAWVSNTPNLWYGTYDPSVEWGLPFHVLASLQSSVGDPLPGALIRLQQNVSGTWTNVAENRTNSTGWVRLQHTLDTMGTYQFRMVYAGNATWGNATSRTMPVSAEIAYTKLTATAVPSVVRIGHSFVIKGVLTRANLPSAVPGARIVLVENTSGTLYWTVRGNTTTNATGAYRFNLTTNASTTVGTHQYATGFLGNTTYYRAQNSSVYVTVQNPTTLSLNTSKSSVNSTEHFTLYGYLKDANGKPLPNKTVQFYYQFAGWPSTTWVAWKNVTTNASGRYSMVDWETATIRLYTVFHGDTHYSNATSNTVTVTIKAAANASTNASSVGVVLPFAIPLAVTVRLSH